MGRKYFLEFCFGVFVVFSTGGLSPALAFYSCSGGEYDCNLTGSLGVWSGLAKYPAAQFLYEERSEAAWYSDLRLLADASAGENLVANMNILQNVRSTPVLLYKDSGLLQLDVERSGLFYWQQHASANTQAAMVVDAGYLKYGNVENELTVGRQPVSTSVTFFFTPNDFFAPFSPNAFYRVYKPGVDALRYERKLANLSQLSVIGVLGYDINPATDSGWSNSPDLQRSSVLARFTDIVAEFEWGALCGIVRESMIAGFSLQGELFQWLGIRAEGHYAGSFEENGSSGLMLTGSFEHRYQSSLNLRLEQMYNSFGFDSITAALAEMEQGISGQGYLGRHYTAVDMSYQISPLITGEILYLRNWSDNSYSLSFNGVYSVSDESELSLTASLPGGPEPGLNQIRSELGSLPVQFSLEYRHYF